MRRIHVAGLVGMSIMLAGLFASQALAQKEAMAQAIAGEDETKKVEVEARYETLTQSGLSVQEANTAVLVAEQAAQEAKAEETQRQFLGINWGMGVAVSMDLDGGKRVKSARVVNSLVRVEEEDDLKPRIFLETHNFLNRKVMGGSADKPTNTLFGHGPFAALQSSSDEVIEAFAIGYMWGFRQSPESQAALNFGIGINLDPSVQILGDGINEGKPLTEGDELRYKKESRVGLVIMTSFSF